MNRAALQTVFVELAKISMSNSFGNGPAIAQQFFLAVSLAVVGHFRSRLRNEKEKPVVQERMIPWSSIYGCFHEHPKAVILSHYKGS